MSIGGEVYCNYIREMCTVKGTQRQLGQIPVGDLGSCINATFTFYRLTLYSQGKLLILI